MDNGFYCKHMIGLFGVRLVVLFEEAASILINLFFAFCIIVTVNINVLCVCVFVILTFQPIGVLF